MQLVYFCVCVWISFAVVLLVVVGGRKSARNILQLDIHTFLLDSRYMPRVDPQFDFPHRVIVKNVVEHLMPKPRNRKGVAYGLIPAPRNRKSVAHNLIPTPRNRKRIAQN
eukprot:GEMP01128283.1.p1 GENE.GEMP01128283.1~~GEMP01128283.1.p1  ORF type:complete len:110 (+),score=6.08 GEMP01128283.1:112-441(+)